MANNSGYSYNSLLEDINNINDIDTIIDEISYAIYHKIALRIGVSTIYINHVALHQALLRYSKDVYGFARTKKEIAKYIKDNNILEDINNNEMIKTKYIVNAAGIYADKFHNMVSENKINIKPRRGDYILLDSEVKNIVSSTIFALLSKFGKGILVTPTVYGNIMIGPTAIDIEDKEGVNTTTEGLNQIIEKSKLTVKNIPYNKVITSFAGLRPHEDGHEFIIKEVEDAENFIDCAGIESPGLASSPAIGVMVADILKEKAKLETKKDFIEKRKGITKFMSLSNEEKNKLIKENHLYGHIICRCEKITEGEIVEAIKSPIGAKSLDGIKRRVRAGLGRCQGGFCSPKIMEILSRELNINILDITKSEKGSEIIKGFDKESL